MTLKERLGRCYELSGRYVLDHPDATLVHGSIQAGDRPRLAHAWVEKPSGVIYDAVMDEEFETMELYVWFAHAEPEVRYSLVEMCRVSTPAGHWGPWE